jgi:predicted transcriptional regulator
MKTLKKYRRMVGLTQHEVSSLSSIPLSRIVYAETGRIKLRREEVAAIKSVIQQRATKIAAELSA